MVEENHFDRLPTELIVSIFDKILDVKRLCICCSVSKRFSALVLQTRCVSLQIRSAINIGPSVDIPVWPPEILNFLKKLCCVESVTVRFCFGNRHQRNRRQRYEPFLRWKSDSSSFIFVSAKNRIASREDDSTYIEAGSKFTMEEYHNVFRSIACNLRDCKSRFLYIKELLALVPNLNLKSVSAVDSMKRGSLILKEDGIARMKKEKPLEGLGKSCIKLWRASLVKSPYSGCIMKEVTLFSTREIAGFTEENLFEDEEYREIAMTMMKEGRPF